jgi:hypothetical protein
MYSIIIQLLKPAMILITGVIGNSLIIIIYSRKAYNHTDSRPYFISLAMSDMINSILYTEPANLMLKIYEKSFICSFIIFLCYFFGANSTWYLTIINLERLLSTKYQNIAKTYLQHKKYQLIVVGSVIVWNFVVYSGRLFIVNPEKNDLWINESTVCTHIDTFAGFKWLDLVNATIVPFLLMLSSSMLIIHAIYSARKKIHIHKNERKLKRDAQYSTLLVALNVIFLAFNLPFHLYGMIGSDESILKIVDFFYSIQFTTNIFVYLLLNSKFRREFLNFIKRKK